MRRIMAIVAVLLMFVSQPTSAATFSDLEGNNHAEAIYALVEQGIIKLCMKIIHIVQIKR